MLSAPPCLPSFPSACVSEQGVWPAFLFSFSHLRNSNLVHHRPTSDSFYLRRSQQIRETKALLFLFLWGTAFDSITHVHLNGVHQGSNFYFFVMKKRRINGLSFTFCDQEDVHQGSFFYFFVTKKCTSRVLFYFVQKSLLKPTPQISERIPFLFFSRVHNKLTYLGVIAWLSR